MFTLKACALVFCGWAASELNQEQHLGRQEMGEGGETDRHVMPTEGWLKEEGEGGRAAWSSHATNKNASGFGK